MQFSKLPISSLIATGLLGLTSIPAAPVHAIECSIFAIGMEADNCRAQIKVEANTNAPASIEQFRLSLATQLPIAIASYNQTVTATIAQRQAKPTVVISQGNLKNLPMVSLSVEASPTAQIALNR